MRAISTTKQHCPRIAAIRSQGTAAVWSGFIVSHLVKYGAKTELDNRMLEVRG